MPGSSIGVATDSWPASTHECATDWGGWQQLYQPHKDTRREEQPERAAWCTDTAMQHAARLWRAVVRMAPSERAQEKATQARQGSVSIC